MATQLFPIETFESGALPGSFDSVSDIWRNGLCVPSIDNTSKVDKTYSVKFHTTGSGSAAALKVLASTYTDIYVQFKLFLGQTFALGPSNYTTIFDLRDSSDNSRIHCNMEFNGSVFKLTFGGDVGYTNSGVIIPKNQINKIQIHINKDPSLGRIQIWLNNDVSASPTYDSGNINTGATAFKKVLVGLPYVPEAISDLWFDDIGFDTAFIGGAKWGFFPWG
jgi:hypothetical protein